MGMYSRKAWGGDTDPFILTTFPKFEGEGDEDPIVSLVIFEWRDEEYVGVWETDEATKVCAIRSGRDCNSNTWAIRKRGSAVMMRLQKSCAKKNNWENL